MNSPRGKLAITKARATVVEKLATTIPAPMMETLVKAATRMATHKGPWLRKPNATAVPKANKTAATPMTTKAEVIPPKNSHVFIRLI